MLPSLEKDLIHYNQIASVVIRAHPHCFGFVDPLPVINADTILVMAESKYLFLNGLIEFYFRFKAHAKVVSKLSILVCTK